MQSSTTMSLKDAFGTVADIVVSTSVCVRVLARLTTLTGPEHSGWRYGHVYRKKCWPRRSCGACTPTAFTSFLSQTLYPEVGLAALQHKIARSSPARSEIRLGMPSALGNQLAEHVTGTVDCRQQGRRTETSMVHAHLQPETYQSYQVVCEAAETFHSIIDNRESVRYMIVISSLSAHREILSLTLVRCLPLSKLLTQNYWGRSHAVTAHVKTQSL